jgi:hypothetical protein
MSESTDRFVHKTDDSTQYIRDFWRENSNEFTHFWTATLSNDYRKRFISKIKTISDFNNRHVGIVDVVAPELAFDVSAQNDGFALLHLFHHINTLSNTISKDYKMFATLQREGFFEKMNNKRFLTFDKNDYMDTRQNIKLRINTPDQEQLDLIKDEILLEANLFRLCEIRQYLITAFLAAVIERYEKYREKEQKKKLLESNEEEEEILIEDAEEANQ